MKTSVAAIDRLAGKLCQMMYQGEGMSYAAFRVASFILGASRATGTYPLDLTTTDIMRGFERDGVKVNGTGANRSTVNTGLDELLERGIIERKGHTTTTGGYCRYFYTVCVGDRP